MTALAQLYQQVILDAARARHGYGLADGAAAESVQVNPVCGDEIRLRVHVTGTVLEGVSWEGTGCSISQASASVMVDLVQEGSLDQAESTYQTFRTLMDGRGEPLDDKRTDALGDAAAFVGVARYPARIKCALLGWMALRDALARVATQEETP